MIFQLRHKEFGIFQGECMGFGFWHPTSEMPEQGLYHFPTQEDVEEYRDFLCSTECSQPLDYNDLSIESLDEELEQQMIGKKE